MNIWQGLFYFLIIFINIVNMECKLIVSVSDLNIKLHSEDKFLIEVSDVNVSNAQLDLTIDNKKIVDITPSSIKISLTNPRNYSYVIKAVGKSSGRAELAVRLWNDTSIEETHIVTTVYKRKWVCDLSLTVGWIYFLTWSISYYPQVRINYLRQSVLGPHIDYFVFSFVGTAFYALFNVVLFIGREVQCEYIRRFPEKLIPVRVNDVLFSVHGTFMSLVIVGQFMKYEGTTNLSLSITPKIILALLTVMFVVMFLLSAELIIPWLDFLNFCSSVSIITCLIQFIPQVLINFKHKSVVGVRVNTVLFNIVGGICSVLQMLLDSYNYDDWISIFGNFTKFGLGLSTLLFDGIILLQYYVLYQDKNYVIH